MRVSSSWGSSVAFRFRPEDMVLNGDDGARHVSIHLEPKQSSNPHRDGERRFGRR